MPRNPTTGVYTMPGPNSFNPAVPGELIDAADWNAVASDLQTALSHVPASGPSEYATAMQVQNSALQWAVATGGPNAWVLTLTPPPTAYAAGMTIRFRTGASANTGAVTVNVNGLGTRNLRRRDGAALVAGDLPADTLVTMTFDGTVFRMVEGSLAEVLPRDGSRPMTGALLAALGSATAPGYAFNGRPNVGMYSPTTNTLGLVAGGGEGLRIDSARRVAIGENASQGALVFQGTAGRPQLQLALDSVTPMIGVGAWSDTLSPAAVLTRARGSLAGPADVVNNDTLGAVNFNAFVGSGTYQSAVSLRGEADANVIGGAVPGRLRVLIANSAGTLQAVLAATTTGITASAPISGVAATAPAHLPRLDQVRLNSSSEVSLSGSTVDVTGIPDDAREIVVVLRGANLSTTSDHILIQIGTGTSPATSGYVGLGSAVAAGGDAVSSTSGIVLYRSSTVAVYIAATVVFRRIASTNRWLATIHGAAAETATPSGTLAQVGGGGHVLLSGAANMVRLRASGSATWSAGNASVQWRL